MKELAPTLLALIDEISGLSGDRYREGGMFIQDFRFSDEAEIPVRDGISADLEEIIEFFAFVLGGTTTDQVDRATSTATKFTRELENCYPNSKFHYAVETDGWSGDMEVWILSDSYQIWFDLFWSID